MIPDRVFMIALQTEQLIPLRDVPRRLPVRPNGKKLHISAVYRWASRGVRGVKLETTRIGGGTYTSIEALQRFTDALNGRAPHPQSVMPTTRTRQKQIQAAERRLNELLGGDQQSDGEAPPRDV